MKPGSTPIKEWSKPTWEKDDLGDWVGPGQPSLIGPRTPYWYAMPEFVDRCERRFARNLNDLRDRPEILQRLMAAIPAYAEAVLAVMRPLRIPCNVRLDAKQQVECVQAFLPAYAAFGGFKVAAQLLISVGYPTLTKADKVYWFHTYQLIDSYLDRGRGTPYAFYERARFRVIRMAKARNMTFHAFVVEMRKRFAAHVQKTAPHEMTEQEVMEVVPWVGAAPVAAEPDPSLWEPPPPPDPDDLIEDADEEEEQPGTFVGFTRPDSDFDFDEDDGEA